MTDEEVEDLSKSQVLLSSNTMDRINLLFHWSFRTKSSMLFLSGAELNRTSLKEENN
ncbi:hypothetical protein KIN20_025416 [Parelaphostrongylus tenuis]|uniref:Uncharacterized protein n=1 Tax=Parelaphostrongylus tenuis TaxID=148309 RepID=A0AAD5N997_PARTN|nr:hypothetical protein KIN20_025416 [Parelaphostrongylus tenuis]